MFFFANGNIAVSISIRKVLFSFLPWPVRRFLFIDIIFDFIGALVVPDKTRQCGRPGGESFFLGFFFFFGFRQRPTETNRNGEFAKRKRKRKRKRKKKSGASSPLPPPFFFFGESLFGSLWLKSGTKSIQSIRFEVFSKLETHYQQEGRYFFLQLEGGSMRNNPVDIFQS